MSRSRMPQALRLHGPQVEYVGQLIKQAKRRVLWKFAFDGDHDDHSVTLHHTLNSVRAARSQRALSPLGALSTPPPLLSPCVAPSRRSTPLHTTPRAPAHTGQEGGAPQWH